MGHEGIRTQLGGVLVPSGIALANDLNVVGSLGQTGEGNGCGGGRLRAPATLVQPPSIVSVTRAVGPTRCWNAVSGSDAADRQRGGRLVVGRGRFTGNGCAQRNDAALVATVWTHAAGWRTRPQAKPIPHYLRIGPIRKIGFGNGWDISKQRFHDAVTGPGAASTGSKEYCCLR